MRIYKNKPITSSTFVSDKVELYVDIDENVTVEDDLGSWSFDDESWADDYCADGRLIEKLSNRDATVVVGYASDIVYACEELLTPNIPADIGTYNVVAHIKLVYDVDDIEEDRDGWFDDSGFQEYTDVYTDDATVTFNYEESKVLDVQVDII